MGMRGIETLIYDAVDDPDFVHALLRFTTDLSMVIGDAILETGVGMLTLGDPSAGCSVLSPSMFRDWVKPYLQETIQHFKSKSETPIFLHICGFVDPIMEDLVSIGVDGLSIDGPSSLEKLVEISQEKIVVEGNFPTELYIDGTKDQIETKVKELVETAAEPNGNRYILCSGCQVPDAAPLENVRTFLEAGQKYGKIVSQN
jgi:uroporphyrinogen decarboxylase